MGNLRAVLFASVASLAAACGGDGGSAKPDAPVIHLDAAVDAAPDTPPLPDAPSYDLTCLNNTAPTTAAANVTISGTTQEISASGGTPTVTGVSGAVVKSCKGDCTGPNSLGMVTSGAGGAFSTAPLSTGGTPLDGYIDVTRSGDRRTLVYPPSPLTMNQSGVPVLMFNTQAFAALNSLGLLSPPQNDTTNGLVGIVVTDCMNTPITEGVVVSVKQNNMPVGNMPFDLSSLAAQGAGTWLIANVPAGDTTVSATYNGMAFRAHVVTVPAGTTVTTGVRPGY
ncbi:MAG: hypothetical protein JNL83_36350 [Myxococcales bacterium]|nr:hypothetical protein [Myxococcales bacterium]